MLLKTLLIKQAVINIGDVTHIKVNDDIQFKVVIPPTNKNSHVYQIQDVKGDFEILEIRDTDDERSLPYDRKDKTFASNYHFKDGFVFHILADIEFQIVGDIEEYGCTDNIYKLHVPQASLSTLKPRECFEKSITFKDLPKIALSCFIKKVDQETIEVQIDNPHHIGINGDFSEFRMQFYSHEDVNVGFVFDLTMAKHIISKNDKAEK